MSPIKDTLRNAWRKSIETIGTTADGIATSAKNKVDEMNLVSRRREVMLRVSEFVYARYLQGEHYPAELIDLMAQVAEIDQQLAGLKAAPKKQESAERAPSLVVDDQKDETKATASDNGGTMPTLNMQLDNETAYDTDAVQPSSPVIEEQADPAVYTAEDQKPEE